MLVIQPIHDAGLDLLRARDDIEFEVTTRTSERELIEQVSGIHGIAVRTAVISRVVVEAADALQIVSRHGVGYDAVDLTACGERGIPVTITPGANSVSVAEHAMFMILALAKQCFAYDRAVRDERFAEARHSMTAVDIENRHLLIVGFGRIGSRLAPRAKAFGMRVSAYDPYIDQEIIRRAGCEAVSDFRSVLGDVDVLSVHCPLTAETNGMFAAAELARMKPRAIVINTARGGVIDERALAEALHAGRVAGAGLDVFEGEPAPPRRDNRLFQFENVILSPHSAGLSLEASVRTAKFTVQNVLDCFDGRLNPELIVNRAQLETKV